MVVADELALVEVEVGMELVEITFAVADEVVVVVVAAAVVVEVVWVVVVVVGVEAI